MSDKTSLGDRIKTYYEDRFRFELMRRTYTLIRIDGKAFHTFTKRFKSPFDDEFMGYMDETAKYLCKHVMGVKFAYVQSDEITLLLTDFDTHQTQAWFELNIQKMASIASSMATARFNKMFLTRLVDNKFKKGVEAGDDVDTLWSDVVMGLSTINLAEFDARVFQVPNRIEAFNAVLWRQQDATRNSIQAVAQAHFSDSDRKHKNTNILQDMLFTQKGINWNDFEPYYKRGRIIRKEGVAKKGLLGEPTLRSQWVVDRNIPIFSQDKSYLYNLIPEEEIYEPEEA